MIHTPRRKREAEAPQNSKFIYNSLMIIALARKQLAGVPASVKIARSIFGYAGVVKAQQVREAFEGRPDNDYVRLWRSGENPEISVCRRIDLPKFSCCLSGYIV